MKMAPTSGAIFIGICQSGYTLKEEPHPQVLFTDGFSNLKPAASSVST